MYLNTLESWNKTLESGKKWKRIAYQFVGLHIEGDNALIRSENRDLHAVDSNATKQGGRIV